MDSITFNQVQEMEQQHTKLNEGTLNTKTSGRMHTLQWKVGLRPEHPQTGEGLSSEVCVPAACAGRAKRVQPKLSPDFPQQSSVQYLHSLDVSLPRRRFLRLLLDVRRCLRALVLDFPDPGHKRLLRWLNDRPMPLF